MIVNIHSDRRRQEAHPSTSPIPMTPLPLASYDCSKDVKSDINEWNEPPPNYSPPHSSVSSSLPSFTSESFTET